MCKRARSRLVLRAVTAAQHWRTTLRDALLTARKDRDAARVSALRSALSAIDNAGAVPTATLGLATPVSMNPDAPSSGTIAGGVVGLGAAEVARRELSDAQIRELVRAEIDERLSAAKQIDASHTERAATLRTEAAVLGDMLGDV
ncbi:MAG: uncharacterized protein QOD36_3555 [Mycobacterium sp.]|nr:uncharacterized protein [Mycobacterium sp.]